MTAERDATAIERLARFAAGAVAPEAERARARLRLLDIIGLAAAGGRSPAAAALEAYDRADPRPGATPVLVWRAARASAGRAAFLHGALAHAWDYDDTFADSVVHPGAVVVPAALAAGAAANAPMSDLLDAVAVGYEVAARLGAVAGRSLHARGFHATGVIGPLAAAAAVCRVRRAPATVAANAIGLATSCAGGLLAFLSDGAWSKWMHCGAAAERGVAMADLAGAGFRGPLHALEGPSGLFAAFAGLAEPDLETALSDLGATWRGADARSKRYPCAHVVQPYLDALLSALNAGAFAERDVAAVTCRIAPWAVPIVCEPRDRKLAPEVELDGVASLPFLCAAALCDGRVDIETLSGESLRSPRLRARAADIRHTEDAALGRDFDGALTVALRGGGELVLDAPSAPPDETAMREKFRGNLRAVGSLDAADRIEAALLESRESARLGPLASALVLHGDGVGKCA